MKKNFRHNNKVLTFQIDIFNVLNANAIRAANNNVGASLGNATTIMTGPLPAAGDELQVLDPDAGQSKEQRAKAGGETSCPF